MQKSRMLFIAAFIVFAVMTAGCGKTWTYDFTAINANADDWIIDNLGSGVYDTVIGKGLYAYDAGFASPKSFIGDFTMEAEFELDVNFDDNVYFEFYPADGPYWEPDNYIYSYFDYIGWTDEEEWYVQDIGSPYTSLTAPYKVDELGNLPQLNRTSINKWKLIKKGESYEIWINGYRVADFDSLYCRGDQYCLTYYAEVSDGLGEIWLRKVKVTYSGSMIDTPDTF